MDRHKAFRKFPELRTKRLVLREPTMDDDEWYLEHFSRPEIVYGQGFPAPKDIKAAREELSRYLVDHFKKRDGFRWLIVLKGSQKVIGSVGYYKWVRPDGEQAEMGYDLDKEYWGKGYMSEAMRASIDFGFKRMKLNRIEIFIMPRNRRSARLVKRLGFVREGLIREHGFDELGNRASDVLFSMLKRDWLNLRKG